MLSNRMTVLLLAMGVMSTVPFLMAPGIPGCDICQRWSGNLTSGGLVDQTTPVTNAIRYEAFAEVNSGSVSVNVTGPVQGLSCSGSGNQGWCTFTATSTANVTIHLTGSPNAAYTLYFGAI
jgi:hypothetical protein